MDYKPECIDFISNYPERLRSNSYIDKQVVKNDPWDEKYMKKQPLIADMD
jgi:hypothetical protein